jgi:hypothetical protein
MFSAAGTIATTLSGSFMSAGGVQDAEYARRAAHVELHLLHPRRRLDVDATRVERDSLADEDDGQRLAGATAVLDQDQLRRLAAAGRDGEECIHAEVLDIFPVEDLHLEGVWRPSSARLVAR